jgi:ubiquinone/menaquinone biosynthesis C-methylase UbiE
MNTANIIKYIACPVCKMDLNIINESKIKCNNCNYDYKIDDGIPILLPHNIDEFKRLEAEYHDVESDSYSETNMISSFRVVYYHEKYLKYLRRLPFGSVVLEVGGGDGTDAFKLLNSELIVIQSDISTGMMKNAKAKNNFNQFHRQSTYLVCDAEQMPCKNVSIDAVMIVAALHHLPSPEVFFKEVNRVLKPGGLLVVGFEPNKWPYFFIYPLLKSIGKLLGVRKRYKFTEVSIADQEAKGFSEKELKFFLQDGGLEIVELQVMYFHFYLDDILMQLYDSSFLYLLLLF